MCRTFELDVTQDGLFCLILLATFASRPSLPGARQSSHESVCCRTGFEAETRVFATPFCFPSDDKPSLYRFAYSLPSKSPPSSRGPLLADTCESGSKSSSCSWAPCRGVRNSGVAERSIWTVLRSVPLSHRTVAMFAMNCEWEMLARR